MKFYSALFVFFPFLSPTAQSQQTLASGEQPQITVDAQETVRLIFGSGEQMYYSVSNDRGKTFSEPIVIAEVKGMHLPGTLFLSVFLFFSLVFEVECVKFVSRFSQNSVYCHQISISNHKIPQSQHRYAFARLWAYSKKWPVNLKMEAEDQ
jgi:hypothetical protein